MADAVEPRLIDERQLLQIVAADAVKYSKNNTAQFAVNKGRKIAVSTVVDRRINTVVRRLKRLHSRRFMRLRSCWHRHKSVGAIVTTQLKTSNCSRNEKENETISQQQIDPMKVGAI